MQFQDLLDQYGVAYDNSGSGHNTEGWLNLDCPWCSPSTGRYRLGYNLTYGHCNCWYCGRKPTNAVIAAVCGLPDSRAFALAGKLTRVASTATPHTGTLHVPPGLGPLQPCHKAYLHERGFDPERIRQTWNVAAIGLAARLAWRVYIPIFLYGRQVSWTTRAIGTSPDRYISAKKEEEAVSHKTILYGEDYCRQACLVHEGPLDAWAVGPGAVATCGTSYSQSQLRRIAAYPVRGVLFDSEPGAQARANRLTNDLAAFPGRTINIQLNAKDPADALLTKAGRAELSQVRRLILGE